MKSELFKDVRDGDTVVIEFTGKVSRGVSTNMIRVVGPGGSLPICDGDPLTKVTVIKRAVPPEPMKCTVVLVATRSGARLVYQRLIDGNWYNPGTKSCSSWDDVCDRDAEGNPTVLYTPEGAA